MSASDIIQPFREIIFQGDVDFNSPVSEREATKMAAQSNFHALRQYDTKQFDLNRIYSKGVGVTGRDGIFPIFFDMEIIGLTMYNRKAGNSGTTTLDVRWFSLSGNEEGSIFSTKPSFNVNVGNNAYMIRDFLNEETKANPPSGSTIPVLSKTNFNAGDMMLLRIDSAMSGAEDCSLLIHFRPR